MISLGYLLSVLKKPDSFLGVYFNLYVMKMNVGISSDFRNIDWRIDAYLPFPNFGLLAAFELTPWLSFEGNIGIFALKSYLLDESLYDFSVDLTFQPFTWLGVSISYQEFDVRMAIPQDQLDVVIDYNYRGPGVGLTFSF